MWKYRLPVLNTLRAFEAAARHQSFSKAGKELHVNAAPISRQIRDLELQIGRDLFERHARKIVLTADGVALLGSLSTAFSIMQGAITRLSTEPHAERLIISVDPDFASLWLVPKLPEFCAIADPGTATATTNSAASAGTLIFVDMVISPVQDLE